MVETPVGLVWDVMGSKVVPSQVGNADVGKDDVKVLQDYDLEAQI
jgi:hypothetical protein